MFESWLECERASIVNIIILSFDGTFDPSTHPSFVNQKYIDKVRLQACFSGRSFVRSFLME